MQGLLQHESCPTTLWCSCFTVIDTIHLLWTTSCPCTCTPHLLALYPPNLLFLPHSHSLPPHCNLHSVLSATDLL